VWLGGRRAVLWGGRRKRSLVGGFRSINGCPPTLLTRQNKNNPAVHDLQGMGCDLEHFVVEWDQQCTEDEQAGKGGMGVVVSKSARMKLPHRRPTINCLHAKAGPRCGQGSFCPPCHPGRGRPWTHTGGC